MSHKSLAPKDRTSCSVDACGESCGDSSSPGAFNHLTLPRRGELVEVIAYLSICLSVYQSCSFIILVPSTGRKSWVLTADVIGSQ